MSPQPLYLRIVADIRGRIERGELRPGDRVPSTREITREWGVAMATATRVIAALREEGLVRPRSGAGTVVLAPPAGPAGGASTHRRAGGPEAELSRERVVRTAVGIADAEGLATLSMRRIATALDVATMTLYRYVAGKDDLTLQMVDAVFAERPLPPRPGYVTDLPPGWRPRLEYAAGAMWQVFRRHPWAAELMSMTRPQMAPHLARYAEWSLSALRDAGLHADDMMHTHLAVFGHVRGTALNLGPEEQARRDTGLTSDEWMDTMEVQLQRVLADGAYPTLAWVTGQQFDHDLDRVFAYGLRLLLDGVQAGLARR